MVLAVGHEAAGLAGCARDASLERRLEIRANRAGSVRGDFIQPRPDPPIARRKGEQQPMSDSGGNRERNGHDSPCPSSNPRWPEKIIYRYGSQSILPGDLTLSVDLWWKGLILRAA
jgi:hypothetical protein